MAYTIDLLTWLKGIVYDKDEVDTLLAGKSDTGHTHGDIYYTETEVDTLLEAKLDAADVPTKTSDLTNDGSSASDALTYIETSATAGLVKNDGTIDTTTYLSSHQDISGKEDSSNKVSSWSSTTTDEHYPSEKLVKDSLDDKLDASDVPTKTSDLTNDGSSASDNLTFIETSATAGLVKNDGTIDTNTYLTSHQSLSDIGGVVSIAKQSSADSGYAATYVISQGGTPLSTKINIPLDYLVKSGEVKTVTTDDDPVTGYEVGDKYIDFVINTKTGSGTDEHMYINVKDLVEDTTYDADNSTLQLSNGVFSIKDGGVTRAKLATAVTTELDGKLNISDISFNSTTGVITFGPVSNS